MSKTMIAKLRADRDSILKKIEGLQSVLADGKELDAAQLSALTEAETDLPALDDRLAQLIEDEMKRLAVQARESAYDQAVAESGASPVTTRERQAAPGGTGPVSLGARYVGSDEWAAYLAGGSRGRGGGDIDMEHLALIESVDVNGKAVAGYTQVADAANPARRTPLLDTCAQEAVGTGEFWWVEWQLTLPDGTIVAEGDPAPEATYKPVIKFGQLDKVVAQLPVTEEALEDNTRMRSIIDGALSDGVRLKAEREAAAVLAAASLPTAQHDTLLKAIRVGIGTVRGVGFAPTTVVMNPLDYAEIDIDLLTHTLAGARASSPTWGLTVVEAQEVTSGTAYVGDFLAGMKVHYRTSVRVQMTDSHEAEFVAGILRVKATQRITTKVVRPQALVKVSATATP